MMRSVARARFDRVLRPGGALALCDTAQDDLHAYRGFYEPYREEWARFDPDEQQRETGFAAITAYPVPRPLWSRLARTLA